MAIFVVTKSKGILPAEEAEKSEIVREISSRNDLDELIERIPFTHTIQAPNSKIRKEFYQNAMAAYEDLEWVRVIKSVYLRVSDHNYEEYELDFSDRAKQYLYGQMSIVYNVPFDEVEEFLSETITRQLQEF